MKETRFLDYIICFLVSAIIVFIFRDGERVAVDIVVFIVIGFLFQGVLSYIRDEEMYFLYTRSLKEESKTRKGYFLFWCIWGLLW